MKTITLFTWEPGHEGADSSLDQLRNLPLPTGSYEVDLAVASGVPNLKWEKSITVDHGGRDIELKSFEIKTTKVRRFLPDGKVGTLKVYVGDRRPSVNDEIEAVFTVGALLAFAGSMIGIGTIATLLVVQVRKTLDVNLDTFKEPAAKLVAGAAVLIGGAVLVSAVKSGG